MRIKKITIKNLRNHTETSLDINSDLNCLYGKNGVGKTTVLESIALCGFSKSFLPTPDASLIRNGADFFYSSVECYNDYEIPYAVDIKFVPGSRKRINATHGDNLLPKSIIGELPIIVLSPDHKNITAGSPSDRRAMIDRVLSQESRIYFEEFQKLKKALKQRNNLLMQAKKDRFHDQSFIDSLTEVMIESAAEIFLRRKKFIEEIEPIFQEVYADVSDGKEQVGLAYLPNSLEDCFDELKSKKEVVARYSSIYESRRNDELIRGTTLFGPQKDEIQIKVNGGLAREYASQGQHKSLLISLKFAEFEFLKEKKNETPVVLLDDIFSELDNSRAEKVFELVTKNRAQTFITVTDLTNVKELLPDNIECSFFKVDNGKVYSDG
jgi:DNA replication and repair protein RecF